MITKIKKTKKQTRKKKPTKHTKVKLIQKKETIAEKLDLKEQTIKITIAIFFVFVAIFLSSAAFSYAGVVGDFVFKHLSTFMGIGYYVIPMLFLQLSYIFFTTKSSRFSKIKIFGSFLFLISTLGFIDLIWQKGGFLGGILSKVQTLIGFPVSIVLSVALFVISIIIVFDGVPKVAILKKKEKVVEYTKELSETEEKEIEKSTPKETQQQDISPEHKQEKEKKKAFSVSLFEKKNNSSSETEMTKKLLSEQNPQDVSLPPLSLLSKNKGKIDAGDIKKNANIIKNTLTSFGIDSEIAGVAVGPTVTRYSLKPASGVRVSRISALSDDLALALSAKSILIEAPIPGESLVGIEIPNKNKIVVGARELFASKEFQASEHVLPIAIGKDIGGKTTIIGLEKTPHMLVAGATGAGKSVTIHAILNSLLYKHGPDTLKMILIDPKRVEMTLYNGIPHLLTPVIVDAKKAILALRWAIKEMERRYEVLESCGLQNISSYHSNMEKIKAKNEDAEKMPYIVIVIDELADIMQQYPKELESGIVSIAQKARAVGMHLILSTQRPSVNVVTGLIKANIPTRLALQVASAIDSKTILDMAGAEKLLGQGDMLYLLGNMAKPVRVQSSFISEKEVKSIVKFIKKANKAFLGEDISFTTDNNNHMQAQEVSTMHTQIEIEDEDLDADPLLAKAKEEVILSGRASTSYLQRKFSIGYSRAAKLIDMLEEKGVVGPANGSKPRDVLVGRDN